MRLLFFILFIMSCTTKNTDKITSIDSYTFGEEPDCVYKLSKKLHEISGLAMSADGRLFAHDDESARISQLDYTSGKILKSFLVGKKTLRKDFEGLAIAHHLFYLVSSDGTLYEFEEGKDGKHVDYKKFKTQLELKNNVEGLCYDPTTDALLLACKGNPGKEYSGSKAIYSFSLSAKKLSKKPKLKISIEDISKRVEKNFSQKIADFFQLSEETFAPSGIELHQKKETLFILSAKGRLIVEVSREGELLDLTLLNKKYHTQPEGITFTPEYDLIIADEGVNDKATLSIYSYLDKN